MRRAMPIIRTIIAAIFFGILLNGCTTVTSEEEDTGFLDNAALLDHAQNSYWISQPAYSSTSHYIICCFTEESCLKIDLSRATGQTLKTMFEQMLLELQQSGDTLQYEDVYTFLEAAPAVDGLTCTIQDIDYYSAESSIRSSDGRSVWKFQNEGFMDHHGDTYRQTEDLMILQSYFESAYASVKETLNQNFLDKYPDLASYKDVKYDPYGYLGQDFTITGVAELDDYYNFEYRDLESIYFCIAIEPLNGSYSDRWYIYAEREAFQELFQTLKNGKCTNITLICEGQFIKATKNSLATLIDYCIN